MARALAPWQRYCLLAAALLLPLAVQAGPTGEPEPALREKLRTAIAASPSFADRYEAQVWLLDYSDRLARYIPDQTARFALLRDVHAEATRAGLRPELVLAVMHIESRFDRYALSHAGAMGYLQIMPFWLEELGQPGANLFKQQTNLRMGCTILKFYIDKERGNLGPALARYNGSYGRSVYSDKVLGVLNSHWLPSYASN